MVFKPLLKNAFVCVRGVSLRRGLGLAPGPSLPEKI